MQKQCHLLWEEPMSDQGTYWYTIEKYSRLFAHNCKSYFAVHRVIYMHVLRLILTIHYKSNIHAVHRLFLPSLHSAFTSVYICSCFVQLTLADHCQQVLYIWLALFINIILYIHASLYALLIYIYIFKIAVGGSLLFVLQRSKGQRDHRQVAVCMRMPTIYNGTSFQCMT